MLQLNKKLKISEKLVNILINYGKNYFKFANKKYIKLHIN